MIFPKRHPLSNVPKNAMRHTEPLKDEHGSIHIKPSHRGLLHEELHVAQGKPIPEAKLEKALHSKNPAERKRAVFDKNFGH